jgi:hypothetical protein
LKQEQVEQLRDIIDNFAPQLNAYLNSIGRTKTPQTSVPPTTDH